MELRNFVLNYAGYGFLAAPCLVAFCIVISSDWNDRKAKQILMRGSLTFLLLSFFLISYRFIFISVVQIHALTQNQSVSSVFEYKKQVICGKRWCNQFHYLATTSQGERSVPSEFVIFGDRCELSDYEGYDVLKDKETGGTISSAKNGRNVTLLTISGSCLRPSTPQSVAEWFARKKKQL